MAEWKYRKPEPSDVQGICVVCSKNKQKKKKNNKFKSICSSCEKKLFETKSRNKRKWTDPYIKPPKKGYKHHKLNYCEECGFIPKHKCQLDVDHIDKNHQNNDPNNLQTLCANCHRLKSYYERIGKPPAG